MHRSFSMLIFSITLVAASVSSPPVTRSATPNVVLILIDDLGWMDLACQGNRLLDTPNLDQFARQGMRFTNAYAASPVCSPTRAAILTGKTPARLQLTNHLPDQSRFTPADAKLLPAPMRDHLPAEEVTIAERLSGAGYATGFFGKWHLTATERQSLYPDRQGFQINVGGCSLGGPPTFFDPYRIPTLPDRRTGEYLPDRLVSEAIQFMEASRDKPFFVCLWTYTVHWPMEAPESLLKKYATRTGPGLNDTRYGAMIEAMDSAIGKLLSELERIGKENNTLVMFTSDNGGFGGVSDNRPLRASKGHLYEGGLRVPMIIRWPSVVRAGSECHAPIISMDIYPTLLEAAQIPRGKDEAPDGESLMPLLTENGMLRRDAIFFHYPNYAFHGTNRLGSAIRSGPYKLLEFFGGHPLELYDLSKDIGETHNLASEMPEKAQQLRERLVSWRRETSAEMPIPRDLPGR